MPGSTTPEEEAVPETLRITSHEELTVVHNDVDRFEVEARYLPHGRPPPRHLHPAQDERFTVLAGVLHVELDGRSHDLAVDDELIVPRGHGHRMWNRGAELAVVRWRTTPALDTHEWFRGLATLQQQAEERGHDRPSLLGFAAHARCHRDTFRLVLAGSVAMGSAVIGLIAAIARVARVGTARR
jgi:mannose-6-phosphate isomerase-like protein (cupin superfamily)